MKFLDEAIIVVTSGNGGGGSVHFRREKFIPKGGPDGGDGGRGGSIIIQASNQKYSLLDYHYKRSYRATDGKSGGGQNMSGADGQDIVLTVPLGTLIFEYDPEQKLKKRCLADLDEPQKEVVVAKGGRGGKGNWFFRSSTHQAPKFSQEGEPGEEKTLYLEIQLLADIGLVGFPNAGKSTLLRSISNAKPKVADYPFTTLEPHLGIVRKFEKDMVLSDLPGLIEGASQGAGLGLKFLRHIERNKCLLFLINGDPLFELTPLAQLRALKSEIRNYNHELLQKPSVVALTKTDLLTEENRADIAREFENAGLDPHRIIPISAITKVGIEDLLKALYTTVYGK